MTQQGEKPAESTAVAEVTPEIELLGSNLAKIEDGLRAHMDRLVDVLPAQLKEHAPRFIRGAMNAVAKSPTLGLCTQASFYRAFLESAFLGLDPNSALQYAHLIPYENTDLTKANNGVKVFEAQFQLGYRGLEELARRPIDGYEITTTLVFEGEHFKIIGGTENPRIEHEPNPDHENYGDPNKITHVYAVMYPLGKGIKKFEVVTMREIMEKGYRNTPAWKNYLGEMGRKFTSKRGCKRVRLSPEAEAAIAYDNAIEEGIQPVSLGNYLPEAGPAMQPPPPEPAPKKTAGLADRIKPTEPTPPPPEESTGAEVVEEEEPESKEVQELRKKWHQMCVFAGVPEDQWHDLFVDWAGSEGVDTSVPISTQDAKKLTKRLHDDAMSIGMALKDQVATDKKAKAAEPTPELPLEEGTESPEPDANEEGGGLDDNDRRAVYGAVNAKWGKLAAKYFPGDDNKDRRTELFDEYFSTDSGISSASDGRATTILDHLRKEHGTVETWLKESKKKATE